MIKPKRDAAESVELVVSGIHQPLIGLTWMIGSGIQLVFSAGLKVHPAAWIVAGTLIFITVLRTIWSRPTLVFQDGDLIVPAKGKVISVYFYPRRPLIGDYNEIDIRLSDNPLLSHRILLIWLDTSEEAILRAFTHARVPVIACREQPDR